MKLLGSLSVPVILAVLAVLAPSPLIVSAQTLNPAATTASAPALHAELDQANTFSSSSVTDAPAAGSASFAAGAPAQVVNDPGSKPFSSVGIGVKIGLGGIGFDVATPLVPGRLNIRGGAGFLSYNYSGTISNEAANASLKLNNAEIMVDFFPFKGSFRLSAGTTVYNTTGLTGTVTVAGGNKITIGNTSYTSDPASPITGNLAANFGGTAVPRFTLGWGNMVAKNHHIRFETELGIEIIGTPTVSWSYGGEGCVNPSSGGTQCSSGYAAVASADVNSQVADLQSDVNGLKVFPIFNIGLSYKFGH